QVRGLELPEPLGPIDHDGEDAEAHPVHAGEAELRAGRLPDDVEAEPAVGVILGRGLEPGPGGVDVDRAGLHAWRGPGPAGEVGVEAGARLGGRPGAPSEARAEWIAEPDQPRRHRPGDRSREVDDVADDGEVPGREIVGDAPRAVVDQYAADARPGEDGEDSL